MATRRLGRGLDGLLPSAPSAAPKPGGATAMIEQLHPNRDQPRRHFDDDALQELADSIAAHGVLEPILVRKRAAGGYEIIAGERRWRAAQRAGVMELPIHVRELSDAVAFEAALVENLQREDLNPLETARAFQRLIDEFGHSQQDVADRVGKNRVTVTNALRLLKLPEEVLDLIDSAQLSEGHGRALLTAPDAGTMKKLARAAVAKRMSVRDLEKLARAAASGTKPESSAKPRKEKSANVRDLERRLSHALGSIVTVEDGPGGKGEVRIAYGSYAELDRLIEQLT
jgi:ParB family chromosome partitioning protein